MEEEPWPLTGSPHFEAAAIGIILKGNAGAWFDTDLGGVVAAKQVSNVAKNLSKPVTSIERGDGLFPNNRNS